MNLEDRIKRRLLVEGEPCDWEGNDWDESNVCNPMTTVTLAARIAAREAEHPANLLAQTMQQPRPLELVLDEASVISKFSQEARADEL